MPEVIFAPDTGSGLPASEEGLARIGSFLGPIGKAINIANIGRGLLTGNPRSILSGGGGLGGAALGTAIGGPIGGIIGGSVGSFLGGGLGGAFGGKSKRFLPVGAIQPDEFPVASIIKAQNLNSGSRVFTKFRRVNAPLNADKLKVQAAARLTQHRLRLLGRDDIADKIEEEINRSDRVPSSPAGFAAQIDRLLEIINRQEFGIEKELENIARNPAVKKTFEVKTGLNFDKEFLPEFKRSSGVFVARRQQPELEKKVKQLESQLYGKKRLNRSVEGRSQFEAAVEQQGNLRGFTREHALNRRSTHGRSRLGRYYIRRTGGFGKNRIYGKKTTRITVEEYNRRLSEFKAKFEESRGLTAAREQLQNAINRQNTTPLFDISRVAKSNIFGEFTGNESKFGLGDLGPKGFRISSPQFDVSNEALAKLNFFRQSAPGREGLVNPLRNKSREAFLRQDRLRF